MVVSSHYAVSIMTIATLLLLLSFAKFTTFKGQVSVGNSKMVAPGWAKTTREDIACGRGFQWYHTSGNCCRISQVPVKILEALGDQFGPSAVDRAKTWATVTGRPTLCPHELWIAQTQKWNTEERLQPNCFQRLFLKSTHRWQTTRSQVSKLRAINSKHARRPA